METMTRKKVTFEFVFEYDADEYPNYDDNDYEQMSWEAFLQNLNDYRPQGTVETIEE